MQRTDKSSTNIGIILNFMDQSLGIERNTVIYTVHTRQTRPSERRELPMSRVSDTRQRTREAAAQPVAGAKLPHEITVDQIYAVIQQGRRTTINDELQLWKDERTKLAPPSAD